MARKNICHITTKKIVLTTPVANVLAEPHRARDSSCLLETRQQTRYSEHFMYRHFDAFNLSCTLMTCMIRNTHYSFRMCVYISSETDRKMTSGSPSTGFSSGLSKHEDEQCVMLDG